MSIYTVIYANSNDYEIRCDDAAGVVANARNGTATLSAFTALSEFCFYEQKGTTAYRVSQGFLSFDTSAVVGTPTTINLRMSLVFGSSTPSGGTINAGDTRTVEAARFAWSGTATSNFRSTTALNALTVFGSATVTDPRSGVTTPYTISGLASEFAATSAFNLVLYDQVQRTNGTAQVRSFSTTAATETTGTASDPVLILLTGTPWTFVGTSATVEALATPLTLTQPAGVADGDLLIATISSRSSATTPPSATGWAAVGIQANNNTLTTGSAIGSGVMLYQIRSGTPTLAFTLPTGISVAQGRITAYRGQATIPAALTPTANVNGLTAVNTTYSTARNMTAATTTPGTATGDIGQKTGFQIGQCFLTFNTSGIPSDATTATLHLNMTTGFASSASDIFEVREVSSTANTIAGDSLAALPLLGSLSIPVSYTGRIIIPLNITGMTRGSAVNLLIHSQDQRTGTAPAVIEYTNFSTITAAAELRPFMSFLDAVTAVTAAAGTAVSVTGLTTTQDDDLIVAMTAGGQEATWANFNNVTTPIGASGAVDTVSAPSSTAWTKRAETVTSSGADTSLGVFDAVRTAAGATGNLTVTASISAGHVVIAGAFKIAAASGAVTVAATGVAAAASLGTVSVSTPAPGAIALVQSRTGTSASATTTASFSTAPTAGNLIVLGFASDDYNGTPDSGWTQSTGMEQQTFHGGYLWWRISNGSNSLQYTINSAVQSRWVLMEFSGVDPTPYDTSNGQFVQASGLVIATPAIVPSTGSRLLVAGWGFSCSGGFPGSAGNASNSFIGPVQSNGSEVDMEVMAYRLVTGNGSTSYSSTWTITAGNTAQSLSGLILSFKEAPTIATPAGVAAASALGTATATGVTNSSTLAAGAAAVTALGTATLSTVWNVSATSTGRTAGTALGTATVSAAASASSTPAGQTAATALGNVSVAAGGAVGVIPAGVEATALSGTATVAAQLYVTTTPAGVAATALSGTAGVAGAAIVAATGQAAATAPGGVTVATVRVASVTPADVSATAASGGVSIAVGGGIDITPASLTVAAVEGTVAVAAQQQAGTSAAGVAATALSGTASVGIRTSVASAGVTATAVAGTATVTAKQAVTTAATGVSASTLLGGVSVAAGGSISIAAAGQAAAAVTGTASVMARRFISVAATGVAAATADGVVLATGKTTAQGVGQFATAVAGTVTVTAAAAVAGAGVWTGSAWADKPVKVWTGSAWRQKPVKVWNGSTWV